MKNLMRIACITCLVIMVIYVNKVDAGLGDFLQETGAALERGIPKVVDFANGIGGQSGQGSYDRGKGCTVRWSFKGQMIGFEFKFIGTCVDSCTGIAKTAIMQSKGGSIEHCLSDLNGELARRNEL